jgi:hypothetical protein
MSQLSSLPPEIFSKVTAHLTCKDHKALSLVSSTTRELVLPSLFRNVRIRKRNESIKEAHDKMDSAGTEIKHVIQYDFHIIVQIRTYGVIPIGLSGAC